MTTILRAFCGGFRMLKDVNDISVDFYETKVKISLTNEVIEPLCRNIETDPHTLCKYERICECESYKERYLCFIVP